ncbi:hypothetical protein Elgi_24070 [Paenibacillus elgii]|uniref:hypothetical protein n=1 Tax=Paenibacillus elgii TaxID=189691 RepID=UPI002D7E0730|nr:hypothetical protein Elgi_24070 [Paenibacillus elgii]
MDSIQFGSNENQKSEADLSSKKHKTLLMYEAPKSKTKKSVEFESFTNSWGENYANPFKDRDPNGPMEPIDHNAYRLYTREEKEELAFYYDAYTKAKNEKERQAAHDAANGVRLKHVDSVTRRDFINGGESTIYKTKNGGIGNTKTGLEAVPYLKGQIGLSIVGTAALQAKIQNHELSISIIKGLNGELGAQLTASAGMSASNGGDLVNYIKQGTSRGTFLFVESEFAKDLEDMDYEYIFGGGVGARVSIPIINTMGLAYENDTKIFVMPLNVPTYPMNYSEWIKHIS